MNYLQISNLPIMWVLCSFTVIIAALQALLFIRTANKATKECNINPEIPKQAFRIGLVSAIGPALGVFIVMVGLMSAIGGLIGKVVERDGDTVKLLVDEANGTTATFVIYAIQQIIKPAEE